MTQKQGYSREDVQMLEREYRQVLSKAEAFSRELAHQIERLLEQQGVALGFPVQQRVKSWESISEKLERVGFEITSVNDFQDFVGLRLIVLFKRDVSKVCDLIIKNFEVVRQYDTQDKMKDDRFGYSSVHFVVQLHQEWLSVPTLSKMAGLRAEIQVRTLAQHTWAEASHNLQYKRKESVPISIGRAINRVSALLETVDLEFERVLVERESYRSEIDISGTDDTLNVDLIEKTLTSLLPPANKGDEDYANLLDDLTTFGITTQQQLRDLVRKHLAIALEVDQGSALSQQKYYRTNNVEPPERIKSGVFFVHSGLMRIILGKEFPDFDNYLERRALERHNASLEEN